MTYAIAAQLAGLMQSAMQPFSPEQFSSVIVIGNAKEPRGPRARSISALQESSLPLASSQAFPQAASDRVLRTSARKARWAGGRPSRSAGTAALTSGQRSAPRFDDAMPFTTLHVPGPASSRSGLRLLLLPPAVLALWTARGLPPPMSGSAPCSHVQRRWVWLSPGDPALPFDRTTTFARTHCTSPRLWTDGVRNVSLPLHPESGARAALGAHGHSPKRLTLVARAVVRVVERLRVMAY